MHDELSRLIRDSGHGVLDDGEHFRAVLDDYLDEADATRGEINLLVDAVRLGAFRRLQDQIAHGADVRRAIELAGDELARDRGTTESTSAAWALGVLAFATGGGYSKIRLDAATAYAGVRKREVKHVFYAFTNPSDARW